MIAQLPASADELKPEMKAAPTLQAKVRKSELDAQRLEGALPGDEILAVESCTRERRSPYTAFVVPGHVTRFYYTVLTDDGVKVTRPSDEFIDGYPDDRPLDESHPNWEIAVRLGKLAIPTLLGLAPVLK